MTPRCLLPTLVPFAASPQYMSRLSEMGDPIIVVSLFGVRGESASQQVANP